jgi:Uma2 family endonuclease
MPTLVLDPPPRALEVLQENRRRAGLDRFDEIWEGVLHMVPAPLGEHADISQQLAVELNRPARDAGLWPTMSEFNLGDSEADFRVPDGGIHHERPRGVWHPTAALIVEIVSPGDESWKKLPFYAAHAVDEVLIVDPSDHAIHWLALAGNEYREVRRSGLIDLGPSELAERIDWP